MSRIFPLLLCAVLLFHGALAPRAHAVGDRGADGDFSRRDSFHFTLYQDVDIDESSGLYGSRNFEQELLQQLESAYDRLDRILGLRPERKIEVFVWDPVLFDEQFSGLFKFPAAGFYGGSIHIRGATRITANLVRVLHHELVHAAFDAEAKHFRLPAWMNEGIAEWFEARTDGKRNLTGGEHAALARAARSGQLFSLAELSTPSFGGLGPNAAALAYLESYAFIDFLVKRFGEKGLVRMWSGVLRSRSVERGLRRALRADLDSLETDFRGALTGG